MSVRAVVAEAYREALPALAASALGGLFAGLVLGGMEDELRVVPGLLVVVPALLATRGNVFGALGARLSSGLHQGLIEPRLPLADRRVQAAVVAAFGNGLLVAGFAAVLAYAALVSVGQPVAPLPELFAIALLAGFLSGLALLVAVLLLVFAGYRRGHNPDALVGPIVTTTGDVFGVAALLIAVRIVVGGV